MAGQAVTFTVIASGNGPLTYQWQKNGVNISGATGAAYNFIVAAGDNGAQYRCVVSNSNGSVTSKTATLTVVNNTPPVATITQPGSNTFYHAGDTIHFAGSATDTQDGTLPASAFRWDVVLHHRDHTHDFIPTIEGVTSGSFVIPNSGETDNVVWYRITLTVTDSKGATYSTYRDVKPYVSTLAFVTNPPGLQLSLEGQPQTAPFSVVSVEGMQRMLGAPSPQILNGTAYVFASWSDNGAATHQITTPQNNITYTATFAKDTIFADSFESGDLSKWSAQSIDAGDLSVSSAAAIIGNKGMQAVLDDNTPISVVNETPAGERYYHARFYFNPHSTAMASGDSHVIFFGYSGPGYQTPVVAVELRFSSGSYQVRAALVNDSTVWRYGNWFTIGNAVHFLEVEWQAASTAGANNGALKFWVDNVLRTNITGVDNDTRRIERVRLGAVAGIDPGTHGTEFFDAFESRHTSYIGAAAGGPVIAASASNPDEINAWTEGEQSQNPNFAQQPQSPSLDQHLFLPFSAR